MARHKRHAGYHFTIRFKAYGPERRRHNSGKTVRGWTRFSFFLHRGYIWSRQSKSLCSTKNAAFLNKTIKNQLLELQFATKTRKNMAKFTHNTNIAGKQAVKEVNALKMLK
jgi:hypothetical protein